MGPQTSGEECAPIVVASDGTIDLQWIDHAFRVAGPDREAVTENLPAGTLVIGFRFRPPPPLPGSESLPGRLPISGSSLRRYGCARAEGCGGRGGRRGTLTDSFDRSGPSLAA